MYGRYSSLSSASWFGPKIHPKVAWVFQECWSFLMPLACLVLPGAAPRADCLASLPNRVLLGMYMGHYAYRAFLFPLRMRGGKPMPIGTWRGVT